MCGIELNLMHLANNYTVDSIVYLQHYAEGWDGGEYVIKYDIRPCLEAQRYFHEIRDGVW